jgi:hypothetical protein
MFSWIVHKSREPQFSFQTPFSTEPWQRSRYSDWLEDRRLRGRSSSPGRAKNFHWGPHSLISNEYWRLFYPRVKWQRHEADHSPPTCAKVNKISWGPLSHLSNEYWGLFYPRVKWQGREAHHSPQTCAEVNKISSANIFLQISKQFSYFKILINLRTYITYDENIASFNVT